MSDLISRQRVIKEIDRFVPVDPMMSDYTQGISVGLAIATRCIEEFSQENHDSSQGLVKDLISRQDAKDAIDMALDHIDHVPPWVYDKLLNALNEVPYAEKAQLSEEDATKGATSDLISRQDAIDALGKEPKFKIKMVKTYAEGRSDQWFKDVATIASLPSVEPTIIRCRDCKHHDGIRCFRWNSTIITGFDDFCSNAEKRGEEDE